MQLLSDRPRVGSRLVLAACLSLLACDGSRDKLLADLQSKMPNERALAVKKLAEQNRSEDLVLFTQAAKDPAAIVRAEAALALGKSQDGRVVDLLGELLGDPDESVQARAAMALAEIKSEKAKAYLTLQYGRHGRATRQAIVQALKAANVPGPMAGVVAAEARSIWERSMQALTDGTLAERVGAAEELGKSGRPEAVNRLTPLVKDSQVVLAAAAVRGLGYANDRRAVAAITSLLDENFPELREAACEALLRLSDPSALPKLEQVALERSSISLMATKAIIALPRSQDTDKVLCGVALEGREAEALAAGREMRRRGGCPLEPIIEKLRSSATAPAALIALAGLGPAAREAGPKVVPHLASADAAIRRLAADAMAEMGDEAAGPAVLKLYEQELKLVQQLRSDWVTVELPKAFAPGFDPASTIDPNSASGAMKLKQLELFAKVEALEAQRAKEANRVVRTPRVPAEVVDDASEEQLRGLAAALRAVGRVKAEGAFELLKRYADDPSPVLRSAAHAGLAHLGREGVALAKAGLLDSEREVQTVVAHVLAEAGPEGQAAIFELLPHLAGDKTWLLEALSRAGTTEAAIGPLSAMVSEGGAEAGIAAQMLGELEARGAVDVLVKYLDDPTGVARRDVLVALGRIGDPKAVEAIGRDLYHDTPDVRAAAAEAFASFAQSAPADAVAAVKNGPHVDALYALKSDYYRKVRETAETALERLGVPKRE